MPYVLTSSNVTIYLSTIYLSIYGRRRFQACPGMPSLLSLKALAMIVFFFMTGWFKDQLSYV